MWRMAVETDAFRAAIAGAPVYERGILRLFGIPESEIANTLRAAESEGLPLDQLEITTCLRRGEIEVATSYEAPAQPAYEAFVEFIARRHADTLYSRDGSTIDEQVASLLSTRTVAVAESCTGGLMAARLTELPGSSAYFLGGVVTYSNEAKIAQAGVEPPLIERFGAVSTEVAEALADGAAARFGSDVGIGITGIAGPDGGTEEKPVGLVCFSVSLRRRGDDAAPARITRSARLPGDRADVRERSTAVAMHLLRRLLVGEAGDVRLPGQVVRSGATSHGS
jgi:nicotinamide-nucleotide amidase